MIRVQAPQTKATIKDVERHIRNDEKTGRRNVVAPKLAKSRNRGNGSNRNFLPDPSKWWNIISTHIMTGVNAEGNIAKIPLTSGFADREEYHRLSEDDRKIRRMKNNQRRRIRALRNRRKHGRTTHVAS